MYSNLSNSFFLIYQKVFYLNKEDKGKPIYQKLYNMIKKFLQGIYAEAMNSIRSILFQENSNIIEINILYENNNYLLIYSIKSASFDFIFQFSLV